MFTNSDAYPYAPGLTIVIPVYNREKELKRCLDSIAEQTIFGVPEEERIPISVAVVDDGSTDGTVKVAEGHPLGVRVIRNRERNGAAAARNIGMRETMTEWTMFFDSDDTMEAEHVQKAVEKIGSDVDLIGWDTCLIGLDGKRCRKPFEPADIEWHNIMHGTLATQRYMGRTKLFCKAGGWNPKVEIWNDIELGARLLALKPRVVKSEGCYVNCYRTAASITGTTWVQNKDKYRNTLRVLGYSIGEAHPDWLALKWAILAADMGREDGSQGREMLNDLKNEEIWGRLTRRGRLAVRLAYRYRRAGLRGAARVLRGLIS